MADQGAGGYRHRAVSFAAAALRDGSYSAHAQQELRAKVVQRVAELHAIDAVGLTLTLALILTLTRKTNSCASARRSRRASWK